MRSTRSPLRFVRYRADLVCEPRVCHAVTEDTADTGADDVLKAECGQVFPPEAVELLPAWTGARCFGCMSVVGAAYDVR